jgi:hypothetical protein
MESNGPAMMILCFLSFMSFYIFAAPLSVNQLLSLRQGDNFLESSKKYEGLKKEESRSDLNYKIEVENHLIQSVKIKFKKKMSFDDIIPKDTKGYCLSQKVSIDVADQKYFFFDQESERRFELNMTGDVKEIIIQDIPGAKANRPCIFSEAVEVKELNLKKVD